MNDFMNCYLWWIMLGVMIGFVSFFIYDLIFKRDGGNIIRRQNEEITQLKRTVATHEERLHKALEKARDSTDEKKKIEIASEMGFTPQKEGADDLTIIEGVGPKISLILHSHEILTFENLASADVTDLKNMLNQAGPAYKLAKPESWPKQAEMCVNEQWEALKGYQDKLVGGIEFDA